MARRHTLHCNNWSDNEVSLLREFYPTVYGKLESVQAKYFPNRTNQAIFSKAKRLKLSRPAFLRTAKETKLISGKATPFEIGFITGFIEGEGSICIQRRGKRFVPLLQISNTKKELLEVCQKIIGGNIYHQNPKGKNCKDSWILNISQFSDVYENLERLLPYLITKREQCKLVIEFLEIRKLLPRNFSEYTKRQLEIVKAVRRLNHRGK